MLRKIFGIVILVTSLASIAQGQADPKAKKLLDEVSVKYQKMASFKANFVYTLESPSAGVNEATKGKIWVKGEMYKLSLGEQEIYNNGKTVWTYLVEDNEVNISNYDPEEGEISPTSIYTLYKEGYKYRWVDEVTENGKTFDVVELNPIDVSKQIFKIKLKINKADKSILGWKMFEKSGNRYSYDINDFVANPSDVTAKTFEFNKAAHKGITVNDLRD